MTTDEISHVMSGAELWADWLKCDDTSHDHHIYLAWREWSESNQTISLLARTIGSSQREYYFRGYSDGVSKVKLR